MEIKKTKNIKTEVITDIICDSCGGSCINIDTNMTPYFEFMTLKASWGRNS